MSSLSDDEEALFDDIYGDDNDSKKDSTLATEETKEESKSESVKQEGEKADEDTKGPDATNPVESSESKDVKTESNVQDQTSTPQVQSTIPQQQQYQPSYEQSYQQQTAQEQAEAKRKADLSRDAGKMFIGGLDWDTDEQRLKEYFTQFGEVIDHTIMRESSTGRSRGFGFLTFADSKSVDEVVKTQHVLDGKVIDPKRAIPREEQDKTGKIFVGGIAPEVRPPDFERFFSKFGTIIDAQLMLDKDTGRSRGFGFVTFDSPEAVDKVCVGKYLDFNGRQIEVKRAEPRGPQQQQNHIAAQQQRYLQQHGFVPPHLQNQNNNNNNNSYNNHNNNSHTNSAGSGSSGISTVPGSLPFLAGQAQQAGGQGYYPGYTPEQMSEYYQKMTQYWSQLQQQGGVGAQFAQYAQQLQAQGQVPGQIPGQVPGQASPQGQVPTIDGNESNDSNDSNQGNSGQGGRTPFNAPRGPKAFNDRGRGGRGGFRGRGRGGYRRGGYNPY